MTLRRKSRECALQMLFQWGINQQPPARIEQSFWKSARAAESTRQFANELFEGTIAQAESCDQLLQQLSKNWRLDRIPEIDHGILRLAIYELRFGTAPVNVIIDEAIELARKFSTAESTRFVNGVLDAAAKSLEKA